MIKPIAAQMIMQAYHVVNSIVLRYYLNSKSVRVGETALLPLVSLLLPCILHV